MDYRPNTNQKKQIISVYQVLTGNHVYNYTQVNTDIVNRVYNSSLSLQINTAFRNQFVREGADKFATNKITGLSKMFKNTLEKKFYREFYSDCPVWFI